MKSSIRKFVLVAILAVCSVLYAAPQLAQIRLTWDYPAEEMSTNLTFYVYGSPDMMTPLDQWGVVTNVVGTNTVVLTVSMGRYFYAMTASNFWGESDFSNVASTPAAPRSDVNISISRE